MRGRRIYGEVESAGPPASGCRSLAHGRGRGQHVPMASHVSLLRTGGRERRIGAIHAHRFARDFATSALVLSAFTIVASSSAAESLIRLPRLSGPAGLAVTTFDPTGHAIGNSSFKVEELAEGLRKLTIKMAVHDGGQNLSEVTLAPVPPGQAGAGDLRLVEERSQSTRADGVRLDLLVIDHVAGRASCIPDKGGAAAARHVDLPDRERVVNVPMQLLFQPLVQGEVEEIRFQLILCTDGPQLQEMIAVRGPGFVHEGREIVEIRYGPDLGKAVAFFASRLLPSLSFWFDAKDGAYVGHRMPLHRKGPDVVLVRSGLMPKDLGVE